MNDEPESILLVEDRQQDAEIMLHVLRENGFANKVTLARDGVEAIAAARRGPPPRLMLLDLKLPRLDGIDVLRTLRADERTRCIPVVVLTSSSQERDVLQAYRSGANGYVVKGVDIGAFSKVVGALGAYWLTVNRVPRP